MNKNIRLYLWAGLWLAATGLIHFPAISQCSSCDIIYDAPNPPPANINIAGGAGPFKICLNTNFSGDINTNDNGPKTLCIA